MFTLVFSKLKVISLINIQTKQLKAFLKILSNIKFLVKLILQNYFTVNAILEKVIFAKVIETW